MTVVALYLPVATTVSFFPFAVFGSLNVHPPAPVPVSFTAPSLAVHFTLVALTSVPFERFTVMDLTVKSLPAFAGPESVAATEVGTILIVVSVYVKIGWPASGATSVTGLFGSGPETVNAGYPLGQALPTPDSARRTVVGADWIV